MEGTPETPTIDALLSEVQALAQHAGEALRNDPRVQEVQAKIQEVAALVESARADQPEEPPADVT